MKDVQCTNLIFVPKNSVLIFFSALWLACSARRTACVKALLKLGAQDIGDKNGILPSQLMPFWIEAVMVQILQRYYESLVSAHCILFEVSTHSIHVTGLEKDNYCIGIVSYNITSQDSIINGPENAHHRNQTHENHTQKSIQIDPLKYRFVDVTKCNFRFRRI